MIRKSTWIALALFVVALGALYYMTKVKPPSTQAAGTATAAPTVYVLNNTSEQQLKSVEISSAAGTSVLLDRDVAGKWALTRPQTAATDVSRAEQGISQLTALTALSKLDPAPASDQVGLAPAQYTITATVNSGSPIVVKIGNQTPTASGYYVQASGGPMMVVQKEAVDMVLDLLNKPPIQPTPTLGATAPLTGTLPVSPTVALPVPATSAP